jgi:hypothetical protein
MPDEGPCFGAQSKGVSTSKQESGPKDPQTIILYRLHFEYVKGNGEKMENLERDGQEDQE